MNLLLRWLDDQCIDNERKKEKEKRKFEVFSKYLLLIPKIFYTQNYAIDTPSVGWKKNYHSLCMYLETCA